jgi:hypothetical protein
MMIPLVGDIVVSIDIGAHRVIVDPPEGLIDLNRQRGWNGAKASGGR